MADCAWDQTLTGQNLAEITKRRGRQVTLENAADTLLEIQHSGGCQAIYHTISEEDIERIMKYPFTIGRVVATRVKKIQWDIWPARHEITVLGGST
jgi:hypothetical protein